MNNDGGDGHSRFQGSFPFSSIIMLCDLEKEMRQGLPSNESVAQCGKNPKNLSGEIQTTTPASKMF